MVRKSMGKRKREYKKRAWEASGIVPDEYGREHGRKKPMADTSSNIYESMMRSDAFKSLTITQKYLYVVCKAQYMGKTKPGQLYKETPQLQGEEFFFLSWNQVQEYGVYGMGNKTQAKFYRDMKVLQEKGFIKKVSKGRARQRSVYEYIDEWKHYNETAEKKGEGNEQENEQRGDSGGGNGTRS